MSRKIGKAGSGPKHCYYCDSPKMRDAEESWEVSAVWTITRAVFGYPQQISVCARQGCVSRAKTEGYEFTGYGG